MNGSKGCSGWSWWQIGWRKKEGGRRWGASEGLGGTFGGLSRSWLDLLGGALRHGRYLRDGSWWPREALRNSGGVCRRRGEDHPGPSSKEHQHLQTEWGKQGPGPKQTEKRHLCGWGGGWAGFPSQQALDARVGEWGAMEGVWPRAWQAFRKVVCVVAGMGGRLQPGLDVTQGARWLNIYI